MHLAKQLTALVGHAEAVSDKFQFGVLLVCPTQVVWWPCNWTLNISFLIAGTDTQNDTRHHGSSQ